VFEIAEAQCGAPHAARGQKGKHYLGSLGNAALPTWAGNSNRCSGETLHAVGGTKLERVGDFPMKIGQAPDCSANSGAEVVPVHHDDGFMKLAERWPKLPLAVRNAILVLSERRD